MNGFVVVDHDVLELKTRKFREVLYFITNKGILNKYVFFVIFKNITGFIIWYFISAQHDQHNVTVTIGNSHKVKTDGQMT